MLFDKIGFVKAEADCIVVGGGIGGAVLAYIGRKTEMKNRFIRAGTFLDFAFRQC